MFNRGWRRIDPASIPGPIPFPKQGCDAAKPVDSGEESILASPRDILSAIENVSRRIDVLARELNCLGYFDDQNGRPRAA